MNHDRPHRKISLEDLLSVKRAERPPAEFWTRFEQELRAKQLAAIITKRPWWHALPRAFAGVTRLHLPLGATAVLAVTVLTIREYRVPSVDRDLAGTPSISSAAITTTSAEMTAPVLSAPVPDVATASAAQQQSAQPVALAEEAAAPTVGTGEIARVINGLGVSAQVDDSPRVSSSTSRLIIAANLAAVQPAEAESVSVMDSARGFESRGLPARVAEPLAQLASPKNVRLHARYMGTALPANTSLDTTAPSAGRMDRIRGSQLRPDEFSRFDAHGDRFSIKL